MYKKFLTLLLVLSVFALTGCHPCVERSLTDEDIIEYADEYGLNDYEVKYASWDDIEMMGEYVTGENCTMVPEHTGRQLIERTGISLSILYLSACSDDEIIFYEGVFPTDEVIETEVLLFNETAVALIEINTEDIEYYEDVELHTFFEIVGFYYYDDLFSPLGYYYGHQLITDDEYENNRSVHIVQLEEYTFAFATRIYNVETSNYEMEILHQFIIE